LGGFYHGCLDVSGYQVGGFGLSGNLTVSSRAFVFAFTRTFAANPVPLFALFNLLLCLNCTFRLGGGPSVRCRALNSTGADQRQQIAIER